MTAWEHHFRYHTSISERCSTKHSTTSSTIVHECVKCYHATRDPFDFLYPPLLPYQINCLQFVVLFPFFWSDQIDNRTNNKPAPICLNRKTLRITMRVKNPLAKFWSWKPLCLSTTKTSLVWGVHTHTISQNKNFHAANEAKHHMFKGYFCHSPWRHWSDLQLAKG